MVMPSRTETAFPGTKTLRHDIVQPYEGATADEQDVAGVDLHGFLFAVLACAFHRHRRHGAFQNLEQRLLHAFTRYVAGDRGVLAAFARDLVDFVDIDDALLCTRHVTVRSLDEALQHRLHVVSHIAGFSERGGIGDDERYVHHFRQRLRQIGFTHAGRSQQQDVRLGYLHVSQRIGLIAPRGGISQLGRFAHLHVDTLVMVVYGHRQRAFGRLLPYHITVEVGTDLRRLGQLQRIDLSVFDTFLGDDVHAQFDAFVADGRTRTGDQLAYLILGLAAERASWRCVVVVDHTSHSHPFSKSLC